MNLLRTRWGLVGLALLSLCGLALTQTARHHLFRNHQTEETRLRQSGDTIALETEYRLNDDLDGDLVVVGEQVRLEEDSDVDGDVALVGEYVVVNGEISGDLVVLGERFVLGEDGEVDGEIVILTEQAVLEGEVNGNVTVKSEEITIGVDADLDRLPTACLDHLPEDRLTRVRLPSDCFDDARLHSLDLPRSLPGRERLLMRLAENNATMQTEGFTFTLPDGETTYTLDFDAPQSKPPDQLLLPLMALSALSSSDSTPPAASLTTAGLMLPLLASSSLTVQPPPETPANMLLANLTFTLIFGAMLSGLSTLVVTIAPRRVLNVRTAIQPGLRKCGLVGLLAVVGLVGVTVVLAAVLAFLPAVGVVLLPFYLLTLTLMGGMALIGWVTLSLNFGGWLTRRETGQPLPPLATTALGSMVLFLLLSLPGFVPFGCVVSFLLTAGAGLVGLGAVVVTRVGSTPQV